MLRILILSCLLVCTSASIAAQSDQGVPQMRQGGDKPTIIDERALAGGESIIWRSGQFPLPLTPAAAIRVGIDATYTTKNTKAGQIVGRLLPLRAPIENPFQGKYADRDFLVESEFSGHSSGFKDRAFVKVEPKQILVEVRATDYIVVGREDGQYVVLKPGKWRLDLKCSLTQVVTPDGQSWSLARDPEAVGIDGDKWGAEPKPQIGSDPLAILPYVPGVPLVIPALFQFSDLGRMLIHRPNIVLPAGTDLYFRIERLTATYIGPSTPKVPMEPDNSRP